MVDKTCTLRYRLFAINYIYTYSLSNSAISVFICVCESVYVYSELLLPLCLQIHIQQESKTVDVGKNDYGYDATLSFS